MTNDTRRTTPEARMKRVVLEKLLKPALQKIHESQKGTDQPSVKPEKVGPGTR